MATTQLQLRRGNTASIAAFTGAVAEVIFNTDQNTLVVQDGSTAGGFYLAQRDQANASFNKANSANVLAQSAYSSGNSTLTYATSAYNLANAANVLAQSAYNSGNTTLTYSTASFNLANAANVLAQSSYNFANTVNTYVFSAYSTANTSATNATSAYNFAASVNVYSYSAYSQANIAYSQAVDANILAQSAYNSGNATMTYSTSAFNQANAANVLAQSAYSSGNNTLTYATSGFNKANAANVLAQSSYDSGNNTLIYATAGFTKANAANILAQSAYDSGNNTATYATAGFNKANTANVIAQSAYDSGNTTLTYATAGFNKANTANVTAQAAYDTANTKFNSSGGTISGDTNITGNLTVTGTRLYANTINLVVEDNIITLNSNVTGAPTLNAGIEITRGTSNTTSLIWNETNKDWEFTNDGITYQVIASVSNVSNTLTYATAGFNKANAANVLAQSSYDYANTVNTYSFSAYSYANVTNTLTVSSYNKANAANVLAQSAYDSGNNTLTYAQAVYVKANGVVQNAFVTVSANGTSITPSSNNDTLTITSASANGINVLNPSSKTIDFGLRTSGVTSGNYGGSTQIPVINIDTFGRITSASNTSVSTTINLSGTTGSGSVAGGGTLAFSSNNGIVVSSTGGSTLYINSPQDLRTTASPSFVAATLNTAGYITSTSYTTTTTSQNTIDSFATTTYRSAQYFAQMTSSTSYHVIEMIVLHDGTDPSIAQFGEIYTGASLGSFDVSITTGNLNLLFTPTNAATTVKLVRTNITV